MHDGPYHFDGNTKKQLEFDQGIHTLVNETNFVAFGVGVRKLAFQREFVAVGLDPYLHTDSYLVAITLLTLLMERYVDFLAMTVQPNSLMNVAHPTVLSAGPHS